MNKVQYGLAILAFLLVGCVAYDPVYDKPKPKEKCVPVTVDGEYKGCVPVRRLRCVLQDRCT